jgi:hypothetical protein
MDPNYFGQIIRAPHLNADAATDPNSTRVVALPGAGATALQDLFSVLGIDTGASLLGVYVRLVSSVDATIAFSSDNAMTAPTASDWPLFANVKEDLFATPYSSRYFRVYSVAAGSLRLYVG